MPVAAARRPAAWVEVQVLASTIDHLGRIVALVADPGQGFFAVPHVAELRPSPRYHATALICRGTEVHEIELNDLDRWYTRIDTLGDGAVSGSELAFFSQHRSDDGIHWEVHRAHRAGEAVVETGREHLVLPDGRRPSGWARGKIGRDATLWLQVDGDRRRWYRYELDV